MRARPSLLEWSATTATTLTPVAAAISAGVAVYPLHPHAGEAAKRVIVQVTKASRAPLAMLHGLVLHEADGRYTAEADAVLRGEKGLSL